MRRENYSFFFFSFLLIKTLTMNKFLFFKKIQYVCIIIRRIDLSVHSAFPSDLYLEEKKLRQQGKAKKN